MLDQADLGALYAAHIEYLQAGYGAALAGAGYDALVIHAGSARRKSRFDDQYWPLVPTPAFAHWLPLREADAALIIEPGKRPRLVRVALDDFWDGPTPGEGDHFWGAFDVAEVDSAAAVAELLPVGRVALIADDEERAATWGLADVNCPPALLEALDQLRARKTEYERRCIGEANRRAARGHQAVIERFRAGDASELALHLHYLAATGQDDADTPYKNIVALDRNAATLHHVHYQRTESSARLGQSLLVDAGATFLGYAADITRTTCKGHGAAIDAFRGLLASMEALQREVCARIAVGMPFESLHDQAHLLLADVLLQAELARGSAAALVDRGITRKFFPHGLGHSLGLQVHDVGCRLMPPREDNPFLRNTTHIAPGQVFTIEPGCYFIEGLLTPLRETADARLVNWDTVEALAPFGGIRIEDDIAVVEGGILNLTRKNWPQVA